ncbi:MAG: VanZ family protein [Pirellulaceae bacterium]|nr:VanZ family protein [Pirellulaceae bacterium]
MSSYLHLSAHRPRMYSSTRTSPYETVMALLRITSTLLGVYWLAIFVATHLPSSSLPSLGSDKAYHLIAFSGLSFLLSWVVSLKLPSAKLQISIVLTITILYAMFDEWSQQFVAGRQPDVADVVADAGGVCLGVLAFWLTRPWLLRVTNRFKRRKLAL